MSTKTQEKKTLVEVTGLEKYFPIKEGFFSNKMVRAVDGVSFSIREGETLGLVGESGCGKSTLGRAVIRLHEPTAGKITYDGGVVFDGQLKKQPNPLPFRRKMQIIFQDPSASLDGRMTVGEIVREPLEIHKLFPNQKDRSDRVAELLQMVGLNSEQANRYPHEFSGGQQQRIGIARALAVEPKFIVCDEPISALDVSIQSQIVNMLEDTQVEFGLTYLFIAHDLSVVRHISNRIAVMYLGKIVELADANEVISHPSHPYTQTLISAVPIPDPKKSRANQRIILEGEIPSPMNPPSGCRFHTRCAYAKPTCAEYEPELKEVAPGHYCACLLNQD
jgi:oligopeptide transport system ATP-binding protein